MARILDSDYPEIIAQLKNHEVFSYFLETGNINESYEGKWEEILSEMEKVILNIFKNIE